jgi:SAM-dependent methyltransferase
VGDPEFRRDLYRGTARNYERFRVAYPQSMIDDLAERSEAGGEGRLLDLASGTGQISFALCRRFGQVWAIDQEPDMLGVAREKAEAAGIGNIRFVASAAEDLSAPEQSFDLVAIGNAFHRLPRETIAALVFRWLRPGRFLALAWGGSPWEGQAPWQQAMSATMQRWQTRAQARGRVPPGYERARSERPDVVILREAGFQLAGSYRFPTAHEWTIETLTGFVFSTSVLSRAALGGHASAFANDLQQELRACEPAGRFRQAIGFAYELACRPP